MTDTDPISPARARSALRGHLLLMPAPLRDAVLDDNEIRTAAGLGAKGSAKVGAHWISVDDLTRVARAMVDGAPAPDLRNSEGVRLDVEVAWLEPDDEGCASVVIGVGEAASRLAHARLLSADRARRLAGIDDALRELTIPPSTEARLRDLIEGGSLDGASYMAAVEELGAAPETFLRELTERFPGPEPVSFGDLVPRRTDTLAAILGERGPETALSAFARGAHDDARRRSLSRHGAARALSFFGPVFVSPSLSLRPLAVDLSTEEAVTAARKLASAGDPFSALAGLDLCAARLSGEDPERFVEVGTQIIDVLFGHVERTKGLFERYAACACAALGMIERRATLAGQPLFYRRLSALAWAGHVVRVLPGDELDDARFLEGAFQNCGDDVLVSGWRQRQEAPLWRPEWLDPDVLTAYAIGRAHQLLVDVGENAPSAWRTGIEAVTDRTVEDGLGLRLLQPGPLDEFSDDHEGLPAYPAEDLDRIRAALAAKPTKIGIDQTALPDATADPGGCPDDLRSPLEAAFIAYAFDAPDSGDKDRFVDALSTWAGATDATAENVATKAFGLDAALHLAGRWRHGGLADAAFQASLRSPQQQGGGRGGTGPLPWGDVARLVLDHAAAAGTGEAWAERVKSGFEQVAFSLDLTPEQAKPGLSAIAVLCRHDRALPPLLARARLAMTMRL